MGQWSDLPAGLVDTIDGLLSSYGDKVRVHAVCVSWNFYLPKVRHPLPRMLQAFKFKNTYENESNPTHGLYNLLDKKFDPLYLPELRGKLFRGFCYGWVAVSDDLPGKVDPDIFLIDTLTKVKIQLPPRYTFPDVKEYNVDKVLKKYTLPSPRGPYRVRSNYVHRHLIGKVVLSSSPSTSGDFIVVAIYGAYGSLAWCKPGDDSWTSLCETFHPGRRAPFSGTFHPGHRVPFSDLLFYKGRLHALNQSEVVVFDDVGGPNQKLTELVSIPDHYITGCLY